jgi:hypothetical protein
MPVGSAAPICVSNKDPVACVGYRGDIRLACQDPTNMVCLCALVQAKRQHKGLHYPCQHPFLSRCRFHGAKHVSIHYLTRVPAEQELINTSFVYLNICQNDPAHGLYCTSRFPISRTFNLRHRSSDIRPLIHHKPAVRHRRC